MGLLRAPPRKQEYSLICNGCKHEKLWSKKRGQLYTTKTTPTLAYPKSLPRVPSVQHRSATHAEQCHKSCPTSPRLNILLSDKCLVRLCPRHYQLRIRHCSNQHFPTPVRNLNLPLSKKRSAFLKITNHNNLWTHVHISDTHAVTCNELWQYSLRSQIMIGLPRLPLSQNA